MDGWVDWYKRVERAHGSTWQITYITDALTLSLSPMEKNDNLLRSIGYFWSDSLNCFLFSSGPMTPTLMDVSMILGLDVHSSCPTPFTLTECSYKKIVDKTTTVPACHAYVVAEHFENPSFFRLDIFRLDEETRAIFGTMISPCLLPVSMSTSNRINKPGYEFYQPVLVARQFGLNQTSLRLIIHEKILSRADLVEPLVASKAYTIFSELKLHVPEDLEFANTADGFSIWWDFWKSHLFRQAITSALSSIDPNYQATPEEVMSFHPFKFCSLSLNP